MYLIIELFINIYFIDFYKMKINLLQYLLNYKIVYKCNPMELSFKIFLFLLINAHNTEN